MTRARAMRSVRLYGPFVLVVAIAGVLASPAANDFFQFWWAGHLVATGRSPYDHTAWAAALAYGDAAGSVARNCAVPDAPACLWVYPPWTAWLFIPTGALDPSAGIAAQRIVLVSALAVGALSWTRIARMSDAAAGVLLVALAASAPFVRDVVTGHFEGVLLIGLALVAIGLRDQRTWPVVGGAILLALKPHLFVVLAPLVLGVLLWTRRYRTAGVTAFALAALAGAGFVSDRLAWPALMSGSIAKQGIGSGTMWTFAAAFGGAASVAVVVAVTAAAAILAWRGSPVRDPALLVAIGAAVSLAVAPYAQSYDMVLLIPAVAISLATLRRPAAVGAAALIVLLTWLAYVLELVGDPRAFAGVLPTVAIVLLALRVRAERAATLSTA